MKTTKASKTERSAAIDRLKEWIRPGDTIYCILRARAASGMSRTIALLGPLQCPACATGGASHETRPRMLTYSYNAAIALQRTHDDKREGIRIAGCGMDMGFALVDELSGILGYNTKETRLRHEWL